MSPTPRRRRRPHELARHHPDIADDIDRHDGHLTTGFLGTPYLLLELTKAGHSDVAYRLLLQTTYPSWGYMIAHGATTMWERWNGDQMMGDPSMNSYNHYAYGAVAEWLYRDVAGIDEDAAEHQPRIIQREADHAYDHEKIPAAQGNSGGRYRMGEEKPNADLEKVKGI